MWRVVSVGTFSRAWQTVKCDNGLDSVDSGSQATEMVIYFIRAERPRNDRDMKEYKLLDPKLKSECLMKWSHFSNISDGD